MVHRPPINSPLFVSTSTTHCNVNHFQQGNLERVRGFGCFINHKFHKLFPLQDFKASNRPPNPLISYLSTPVRFEMGSLA